MIANTVNRYCIWLVLLQFSKMYLQKQRHEEQIMYQRNNSIIQVYHFERPTTKHQFIHPLNRHTYFNKKHNIQAYLILEKV